MKTWIKSLNRFIRIEKSVLEIDQKYEMTIPTSIDDMELNV